MYRNTKSVGILIPQTASEIATEVPTFKAATLPELRPPEVAPSPSTARRAKTRPVPPTFPTPALAQFMQTYKMMPQKVMALPVARKRRLWARLSDMLEWTDTDRSEHDVRAEIESVFGMPPYEFLQQTAETPRDRWSFHARHRRLIVDPDYRAKRPAPNYSHFVPRFVEASGCEYAVDSERSRTLHFRRPIRVTRATSSVTIPESGDALRLYHLSRVDNSPAAPRRDPGCDGHVLSVESTCILPRAATGSVRVAESLAPLDACPVMSPMPERPLRLRAPPPLLRVVGPGMMIGRTDPGTLIKREFEEQT